MITVAAVFLILAIVCMVLAACAMPSKINLWYLGWAFVICAWLFGARPLFAT